MLMKPGAKWQLFVPPDLAYGAEPQPGIPAGSLLIFDVELLSVKLERPPGGASGAAATPPPPRPTSRRPRLATTDRARW